MSDRKRVGDDWIEYLKDSGNYESYEGLCQCWHCDKIRDGYWIWKEKKLKANE